MDYKDRLFHLHLLPLMMEFEISDIANLFLVKAMENRSPHFDVFNFLECCHHSTRSSSRLWNSLPPLDINLSLPQSSSLYYVTTFGITLFPISIHTIFVPTTICVLVVASLNFTYVCYSLSSFVVCVMCLVSFIWLLAECLQTQHRHFQSNPPFTLLLPPTVL